MIVFDCEKLLHSVAAYMKLREGVADSKKFKADKESKELCKTSYDSIYYKGYGDALSFAFATIEDVIAGRRLDGFDEIEYSDAYRFGRLGLDVDRK